MEQTKLSIQKIEIETFKKIRNLVIEPAEGANLFFGSFRSGKTSVCEFIQFALYGADSVSLARDNAEDAHGRILFSYGEESYLLERSMIGGKESVSFFNRSAEQSVETDLTPGEFLTGLDRDSFDLITYFKQARYETPVFKPKFSFLHHISSFHEGTRNIYRDEEELKKKCLSFCNPEKNGELDTLLAEQERLQTEITSRPQWQEEAASCANTLSEIAEKLDENEHRCVLLKADMARFSDDLKLTENKKNAEDLKKSIQAKEKSYRIASYEVTHKVGLLSESDLEEMKNNYNRLSLSETALAEARTALSSAEENLSFHKKLFAGKDNRSHFEEEKKKIAKNKSSRLIVAILGVILMSLSFCLFFILNYLQYDLAACLATSCALFFCGVALECVSTVFSGSIRKILEQNGKKSIQEFNDFYEKLCAHEKTTQVYLEQVRIKDNACRSRAREKEAITAWIHRKVTSLGYKGDGFDLIAVCDHIIEANDALYDMKRELAREQAEYQRLLTVDVESKTLSVSSEFAALQKELSFLSVQNDSLYKKKELVSARLEEANQHLAEKLENMQASLAAVDEKAEEARKKFEAAELNYTIAKTKKENFETALKESLAQSINQKLSFVLGEGESFFFDEQFELCFRDQDSVVPLISAGGGVVSEMGLLAFRLSLAQLMGKNALPMIFDDSFAMLSKEAASKLYEVLLYTCTQFFIATSSSDLPEICGDSARVFYL